MNVLVASALLALVGLGGLGLIIDFLRRGRTLSLDARIAAQFGSPTPQPWRWRMLSPAALVSQRRGTLSHRRQRHQDTAVSMGEARLMEKLALAGKETLPATFRQQQLLAAVVTGTSVGSALFLLGTTRPVQPVAIVIAMLCTAMTAYWYMDHRLNTLIRKRRIETVEQWPEFIELVALAVAAGDGIGPALSRVGGTMPGVLGQRIRETLADARTDGNLGGAIVAFAAETQSAAIQRCASAIAVAGERGTPLAAVLRDQAADAREADRRDLMESAGKRELGMMVPVVFGVLPLSVVFAVFPGLSLLTMNV